MLLIDRDIPMLSPVNSMRDFPMMSLVKDTPMMSGTIVGEFPMMSLMTLVMQLLQEPAEMRHVML